MFILNSKKALITICMLCLLINVSGCGTMYKAQPPQQSAAEVRALFAGQTVTSRNLKTGTESVSYYGLDGKVRQIRNGRLRTGYWRVKKDGQKCIKMNSNKEICRVLRLDDDNVYRKYKPSLMGLQPIIAYDASGAFVRGDQLHLKSWVGQKAFQTVEHIVSMQRLLSEAGYSPGPIDGVWGPRSRRALLDYQRSKGFPQTGYPNREVLEYLLGRPTPDLTN